MTSPIDKLWSVVVVILTVPDLLSFVLIAKVTPDELIVLPSSK